MDNKYDKTKNNLLENSSEFEQEALEGWNEIGLEKWNAIHEKLEQNIDKQIQKNSDSDISNDKVIIFQLTKYIGIAALLFIILGISFKFWSNNPTDQLFKEYYQPLSAPEDNFRSDLSITPIDERNKHASDAYDELEFKKAIALYSELLKENPNNSRYILFLGLSYINDEKYDETIQLFNSYSPNNSPYDDDIQWYLALAHLKKGELLTSKNLLTNISNKKDNYYADTAQELISKLNQLK